MSNILRKTGASIFAHLQEAGISVENFAEKMGYSIKDAYNVIEGKIFISPSEVNKIADVIGTTKDTLLDYEPEPLIPELQFMKDFNNIDNLDLILDLMDEYVECREVI